MTDRQRIEQEADKILTDFISCKYDSDGNHCPTLSCGLCSVGRKILNKKFTALILSERRKAWAEAVEIAESHTCTGGGCPLSDSSKDGYTNAVSQIAEALKRKCDE